MLLVLFLAPMFNLRILDFDMPLPSNLTLSLPPFFSLSPLSSPSLSVSLQLQGRTHIFKIHATKMSVEKDIRYELLARLCPNSTGEFVVPLLGNVFADTWLRLYQH